MERTGSDVKSELSGLGHLSKAGTQAEEGIAADTGGEVGNGETDVVDLYIIILVSLSGPYSGWWCGGCHRRRHGCRYPRWRTAKREETVYRARSRGSEGGERGRTYARVVQTENVSVAIIERSDKTLEIGAVVCKL